MEYRNQKKRGAPNKVDAKKAQKIPRTDSTDSVEQMPESPETSDCLDQSVLQEPSWRSNQKPLTDYLELLYKDEQNEYEDESNESDLEDDDEELAPEAPPYSPLSSPRRESPTNIAAMSDPGAVVVQIFDEHGAPLEFRAGEYPFFSPDDHDIFVEPEGYSGGVTAKERDTYMSNQWGGCPPRGGRRGGIRGGRKGDLGRGRTRRFCSARRGWAVGHPLHEIWLSDQDVPAEFVDLLSDVVRNREAKMEEESGRDDGSDHEDADDFFDANDCSSRTFEWSPMDSFSGTEEKFLPNRIGATKLYNSAYDAFRSYWDDDILGTIVTETNEYASKISSPYFQAEWYPTNVHEILCLFAFWMMLSIIRMPTIRSCFSEDPLLKTEVFKRIFTLRRYEMVNRALNFAQFNPVISKNDKLHHLRPIITHLNSKFQANYILDKDICIDESLTLWKGKLNIKQYIRNKASKFGIKTFELCESATGYLWSFIVYTGKQSSADLNQPAGELKSTAVVKKLIGPLLHKGYRLFMDNWYNSPLLARFLKRNRTDCVGTLKPTRRDVPAIIRKAPLRRGELIARTSGDVTVLSWEDKKRVTMISTCHDSSVAQPRVLSRENSRPNPFKPQIVLDYNKHMGGVDLKDQMLEPYLLERKRGNRWHMKLFKRFLNVSILNARTLLQSSVNQRQDHLAFRLQLVDTILSNHLPLCPVRRKCLRSSGRQNLANLDPCGHWPRLISAEMHSTDSDTRHIRKRCVVCLREGRKFIKTAYCCESCQVPLCIRDCFKSYHTSYNHHFSPFFSLGARGPLPNLGDLAK